MCHIYRFSFKSKESSMNFEADYLKSPSNLTIHIAPARASGAACMRAVLKGWFVAARGRREIAAAVLWSGEGCVANSAGSVRMRSLSLAANMAPVEHVVADAGAFLRDAPLQVLEIPPRGLGSRPSRGACVVRRMG